ncbi:hypothetical protein ATANTOWER_010645 [Ataeniobius toweri]|uniref:Regulator of microtubule dynamics protein 3 n=1 Tax=Ataeniobius toweri TaxID=208326 RepID=A0ABU7AZG2_9TELE|nr:hypothetical protein [Ataeniobius toweri]
MVLRGETHHMQMETSHQTSVCSLMCVWLQVAMFDWLEKKAAAALYQSPPTATLNDALENFLKAEELNPGFSRTVRLYIAKCHKELGDISEATNWTKLALKIPTTNVRTFSIQ